jgi:hypothetical protein
MIPNGVFLGAGPSLIYYDGVRTWNDGRGSTKSPIEVSNVKLFKMPDFRHFSSTYFPRPNNQTVPRKGLEPHQQAHRHHALVDFCPVASRVHLHSMGPTECCLLRDSTLSEWLLQLVWLLWIR